MMLRGWVLGVAMLSLPGMGLVVAAAPQATTMTADTPRTTPAGTQFTAPAGWSVETRGLMAMLTPPEGGSHIVLVDVEGKSPDDAVDAAWAAYAPPKKWPLKTAVDSTARDDWEQIRHYDYETSAK